jgi:rhamnogalacturonyl hydrolase YesR
MFGGLVHFPALGAAPATSSNAAAAASALLPPAAPAIAPSVSLPSSRDILEAMESANSYFMSKWPAPGCKDGLPGGRPDNIWTRAVYYEGALALHRINHDPAIEKYATDWATFHDWGFRKGNDGQNPDDQCAAQAYIELYQLDPAKTERLSRVRANLDSWTRRSKVSYCSWIDALQMTMPVFAKMAVIDSNPAYLAKMHAMYDHAKTRLGLYNPVDHLWWRDKKFKPPYATPHGKPCYWSRGNGWVVAALVRTLEVLPKDDPHRAEYLGMLQDMSAALLTLQREDGFWNVSLADPDDFGGPETTGTALFIYGMAWAINHGHLPSDAYLPAVARGWHAITRDALHANGFLGYVQGTGDQPASGQPVKFDSQPDFDDYSAGCFLLAGSEIHALGRNVVPKPPTERP